MRIDWTRQFQALTPLTTGHGGVAHVLAPPGSPKNIFARAVVDHLETETPHDWRLVRIDPSDYAVQHLSDLIAVIALECGLDLVSAGTINGSASIGTNLSAEHITISNATINQMVTPPLASLVKALKTQLAEYFSGNKLALVMTDSCRFTDAQLHALDSLLWSKCLGAFAGKGLLIIDIFDSAEASANIGIWPPDADVVLEISHQFAELERAEVREDLIMLALERRKFVDRDKASVFADTLLAGSRDIESLHAMVGYALTNLEEVMS